MTPIIDQVSKDLAYKLQDPVSSGTANGTRISAAERFRYILRGYRRLVRVVTLLYPNQINQIFTNYFLWTGGTTNGSGEWPIGANQSYIREVLAKEPAQEDYVRTTYVEPQDFLSIKNGINTFYVPDLNTRQYYWTVHQDTIELSPPTTYNIQFTCNSDYSWLVEVGGQGGSFDLDISTEYQDIILAAAATEAYLDIGQPDMANAYMNDFTAQIQILATKMQKVEQKNET